MELVVDIESYWDDSYSLSKLSIPAYVHHEKFRVYGMAVYQPNYECPLSGKVGKAEFVRGKDIKDYIDGVSRHDRLTVIGHNLAFDYYILHNLFKCTFAALIDTKLLAYNCFGRRSDGGEAADLASLAVKLGLSATKQVMPNTAEMTGLFAEQSYAQMAEYAINDAKLEYEVYQKLLPQVSNPSVELPLMEHTIRMFCERGVSVDLEALRELRKMVNRETDKTLKECGCTRAQVSKDTEFVKLLTRELGRVPEKLGKDGAIPALAKTDEAFKELAKERTPAGALVRARMAVGSSAQTLARLETMERLQSVAGKVPVQLEYCGAHTGRWAGTGDLNFQNFSREGAMRKLIRPLKPGHKFVICDYAQIEARVLAWLAGEYELLDDFAQDADVYSAFANYVFNRHDVSKASKDPKILLLRQLGKTCILGLGYGASAGNPKNNNGLYKQLVPFMPGITAEECKRLVEAYRAKFPGIPALWAKLDDELSRAISGNERPDCIMSAYNGGVKLKLPSGRHLFYSNVRRGTIQTAWGEKDGILWGPGRGLHGGKIAENYASAIARDVLGEDILETEAMGWKVVLHVHDELVLEAEVNDEARVKSILSKLLSTTPSWAAGLALGVDIKIDDRYSK